MGTWRARAGRLSSPAPGGGAVAALAGALGSALTSMVCNLTLGKKKYAEVQEDLTKIQAVSERLRATFTQLVDRDTAAFNKVMEAYTLPKDTDDQKALRSVAIEEGTKEATLVPLEVMKHCIDALALAQEVVANGNANSVSDFGGCSVGMMAKWSETFALSKIRLLGRTHFCFSTSRANPPYAFGSFSTSIVARTVSR